MPPPTRPIPKWVALTPLLVLAVYVALIVAAERHILFGPFLLPMRDSAADDMLVSDALHLRLLYGNYSRVGFNHPGPWFQYVAAAGEKLFYDWTGLFHSYFAAQSFALSLTHGVALAFAYRLALLVSSRVSVALVTVLVIAAAIVAPLGGVNPFVEFWNPYSYMAAALLVATGLAGVVLRGPSWLPLLAWGCAALVHGHASFIGLVPMMLLVALLLGLAMGRLPFRPWDYRGAVAWAGQHRGSGVACTAIVALFALPLALQVILHWPGPLHDYLHFAGTVKPNPIPAAVRYVLSFMPGAGLWALLLLMPAGPSASVANAGLPGTSLANTSARDIRAAAIIVLAAGTVSAFWYAWRGIDDLSMQYLMLWFTPFAAVGLVTTLAFWLRATAFTLTARLAIGLVCAVTAIGFLRHLNGGGRDVAASRAIERAAAQILASPRPKDRTELFLDPAPVVGDPMWVETVSLLAVLKRAGRDDFCVAPQSWHILFTVALRCDRQHEAIAETLQVTAASTATGIPVLRLAHDVIEERTVAHFPARANLSQAMAAGLRLEAGWSHLESWGVWSLGPSATLSFDATRLPARFKLTLTGVMFAPHDEPQSVRVVDASGHVLGMMEGTSGSHAVTVELARDGADPRIELGLQIAHPVTPSALGVSGDTRAVGFGLTELQITE